MSPFLKKYVHLLHLDKHIDFCQNSPKILQLMKERLSPICIAPDTSIKVAMRVITEAPKQGAPSSIALITDGDTLIGIATDGDIRKAILNEISLDDPIENVMTTNPITVTHSENSDEVLALFHKTIKEKKLPESRFHHIITVDEHGNLVDVFTPFELWKRSEVKIKTAAVIGLGYVGLTLALTLCEFGIRVIGVDVNEDVINKLNKGIPHFYEKGLEALLKKHVGKNLILSTSLSENESDIFIVCVGTPVDNKGKVNDAYLIDAISEVGKVLKPHDLVVLRSTVPIGTCKNIVAPTLEKHSGLKPGTDYFLSFAPERTVEGKALEELKTLPQIIGGMNKQSFDYTAQLFQVFAHTIVAVDNLEEAEAVKLLNNTFRDVSFAFANEVALSFDGHGINARNVIHAANEGYVRNHIPTPSPGVGGACLVKDPHLFTESARSGGHKAKLPGLARDINESMIGFVVKKVDDFCSAENKDPANAKIFLMGMAFKGQPETSDIRHSTSVDILQDLKNSYDNIVIYDPVAHNEDLEALGVTVASTPEEGFKDADCVLVLNNHRSFADLNIYQLASSMQDTGMVFDPWGNFSRERLQGLEAMSYTGL